MNKLLLIATLCGTMSLLPPQSFAVGNMGVFHYNAGQKYFSQSRFEDALNEYQQAIDISTEEFNYWLGKGQAELALSDYVAATNTIERLEDLEGSREQQLEYYILNAQLQFAAKQDGWLRKTKELFFKARTVAGKLKIERSDLYLLMGRVYQTAGKLKKARVHYSEAIVMGGGDAATANNELASIFRQQQAEGSGKGWIGDLAARETIDRATLAYLLIDDLSVTTLFLPRTLIPTFPSDIYDNEYSFAIETILSIKMTSLGLDSKGNFNPNASVTRFELAKVVEEVLVARAKKPELLNTFIGTKSPFPDVSANYHAYNAVFLAVSRGLMTPDNLLDGTFAGKKTVTGADVLLMLRKLGNL